MFPFGVVSQGYSCGAISAIAEHCWRKPGSSSNRQRGCSVALLVKIQKQGNTEAVPVGRKRRVFALFLNYSIAQLFNICQVYKKSDILI